MPIPYRDDRELLIDVQRHGLEMVVLKPEALRKSVPERLKSALTTMKNKRTRFPAVTRATLKKLAGDVYFERGVGYYNAGTVVQLRVGNDGITARVQGSELIPYLVRFWHEKQTLQWGCACPFGDEGAFCKHLVAVGLAYLAGDEIDNEPDTGVTLEEVQELLKSLDRTTLERLIAQQALWNERLLAELRLLYRASK